MFSGRESGDYWSETVQFAPHQLAHITDKGGTLNMRAASRIVMVTQ
jgi:hypothetical protein